MIGMVKPEVMAGMWRLMRWKIKAVGSELGLFISHGYFIKGFLCTGDGDVS